MERNAVLIGRLYTRRARRLDGRKRIESIGIWKLAGRVNRAGVQSNRKRRRDGEQRCKYRRSWTRRSRAWNRRYRAGKAGGRRVVCPRARRHNEKLTR